VDTTTNHTLAAYDRIVFYGDGLVNLVIENSAKAFRFDTDGDFKNIDRGQLCSISFDVAIWHDMTM
jgi:hypothetical protein